MIYDCEVYIPLTGNPFLYGEPFEVSHLLEMMDGGGVDRALTMAAGYDGSGNETVDSPSVRNSGVRCRGRRAGGAGG